MIFLDNDFIDPSKAIEILNLNISKPYSFRKSFFDFDFSSAEGVISFLFLLPIVSDDMLKQAAAEVWPGSVTDPFDAKRTRMELSGFFTDLLYSGVLIPEEVETASAVTAASEIKNLEQKEEEEPTEEAPAEEEPSAPEEDQDGN